MQSFSESQWDAFAFLSQDQTRSTADLPMRLFAAGAPNGQVVVLGGAEGGALHRVQTEAARRRPHAKTDDNKWVQAPLVYYQVDVMCKDYIIMHITAP
jgi:hypothetical protein